MGLWLIGARILAHTCTPPPPPNLYHQPSAETPTKEAVAGGNQTVQIFRCAHRYPCHMTQRHHDPQLCARPVCRLDRGTVWARTGQPIAYSGVGIQRCATQWGHRYRDDDSATVGMTAQLSPGNGMGVGMAWLRYGEMTPISISCCSAGQDSRRLGISCEEGAGSGTGSGQGSVLGAGAGLRKENRMEKTWRRQLRPVCRWWVGSISSWCLGCGGD